MRILKETETNCNSETSYEKFGVGSSLQISVKNNGFQDNKPRDNVSSTSLKDSSVVDSMELSKLLLENREFSNPKQSRENNLSLSRRATVKKKVKRSGMIARGTIGNINLNSRIVSDERVRQMDEITVTLIKKILALYPAADLREIINEYEELINYISVRKPSILEIEEKIKKFYDICDFKKLCKRFRKLSNLNAGIKSRDDLNASLYTNTGNNEFGLLDKSFESPTNFDFESISSVQNSFLDGAEYDSLLNGDFLENTYEIQNSQNARKVLLGEKRYRGFDIDIAAIHNSGLLKTRDTKISEGLAAILAIFSREFQVPATFVEKITSNEICEFAFINPEELHLPNGNPKTIFVRRGEIGRYNQKLFVMMSSGIFNQPKIKLKSNPSFFTKSVNWSKFDIIQANEIVLNYFNGMKLREVGNVWFVIHRNNGRSEIEILDDSNVYFSGLTHNTIKIGFKPGFKLLYFMLLETFMIYRCVFSSPSIAQDAFEKIMNTEDDYRI